MIEIQSPHKVPSDNTLKVFLGGSIEMGTAMHFQRYIIDSLSDKEITFLNPRRNDWDSSWVQDKSNKEFREQVEWELSALELADIIVMYFDPNTKSPISLLELGLHAKSNIIVCCPDGFYRRGNIDIVCEYYKIKQVKTLEDIINFIKNYE